MKATSIILFSFLIILLSANSFVFGQEKEAQLEKTKYGVGAQFTFPAYGISGMLDINEIISAQGVIGIFGDLKTYAAKGLYKFKKTNYWNLYGYGIIGAWSYTGLETGGLDEITETTLGFGGGVGFEYDLRVWDEEMPPIFWNIELGIGVASFDKVDHDFSTLAFGAGIHYRF